MYIAICIDDNNGMMFNRRRQSRDRVLLDDLIKLANGKLYICEYSEKLLSQRKDLQTEIGYFPEKDGVFFAECAVTHDMVCSAEGLIVYHWNRLYPQDLAFEFDPEEEGFKLISTEEFEGSSHDVITKKIWKR